MQHLSYAHELPPPERERIQDWHTLRRAEQAVALAAETAPQRRLDAQDNAAWEASKAFLFNEDSLRAIAKGLAAGVEQERARAEAEAQGLRADLQALRREAKEAFVGVKAGLDEQAETRRRLEIELHDADEEVRLLQSRHPREGRRRRRERRNEEAAQHAELQADELTDAQYQRLATLAAQVVDVTAEVKELETRAVQQRKLKTSVAGRRHQAEVNLSRLKAAVAVSLQGAREAFDTETAERDLARAEHLRTATMLSAQIDTQMHALDEACDGVGSLCWSPV